MRYTLQTGQLLRVEYGRRVCRFFSPEQFRRIVGPEADACDPLYVNILRESTRVWAETMNFSWSPFLV